MTKRKNIMKNWDVAIDNGDAKGRALSAGRDIIDW